MFIREKSFQSLINNDDSYFKYLLALRENDKKEKKRQEDLMSIEKKYQDLLQVVQELVKEKEVSK
jgi:hypothetical protein